MLAEVGHLMTDNMWAVVLSLFFAPFVQEDAAVIGAASLAASGMVSPILVLPVAWLGLSASDLWKYGLGAAARTQPWAKKYSEGPRIKAAGELVHRRLGSAIFSARFIPGTRIALYIAAGYFAAPFPRFAVFILASAAVLLVGLYGVLAVLGEVVGDRAVLYVSAAAIAGLLIFIGLSFWRSRSGGAGDTR